MFQHQDLQMFVHKLDIYMSNFHSLEVVGRGSGTQLQVGDNLNKMTWLYVCDAVLILGQRQRCCSRIKTASQWFFQSSSSILFIVVNILNKHIRYEIEPMWFDLDPCLQRWPNIKPTLLQRLVFADFCCWWSCHMWQNKPDGRGTNGIRCCLSMLVSCYVVVHQIGYMSVRNSLCPVYILNVFVIFSRINSPSN